jgi:hypothetical protein
MSVSHISRSEYCTLIKSIQTGSRELTHLPTKGYRGRFHRGCFHGTHARTHTHTHTKVQVSTFTLPTLCYVPLQVAMATCCITSFLLFCVICCSWFRTSGYCICSIASLTRCTWIYMYSLFRYIFALHVSGAICTHPQEHKLQNIAIGVCNGYGMSIH